jgi:hypothetical protein
MAYAMMSSGHVTCMGVIEISCIILIGNPEGKLTWKN